MASSGDLFADIGILATLAISVYAAYWAFSIRRAMAIGVYRRQALGIGLVSLVFPLGFYLGTEGILPINLGEAFFLEGYASFATLLYWIDASALAARRTDPLLRDTLHWTKVRIWIWALNLGVIFAYLLVVLYANAAGIASNNVVPTWALATVAVTIFLTIFIDGAFPPILGAILLTIAARRSGDMALRANLRWFGLFGLFAFVATIASIFSYPEHHSGIGLLTYAGLLVGGYFLYRSARSLAPLNRLSAG